jgi:hypothetical protein
MKIAHLLQLTIIIYAGAVESGDQDEIDNTYDRLLDTHGEFMKAGRKLYDRRRDGRHHRPHETTRHLILHSLTTGRHHQTRSTRYPPADGQDLRYRPHLRPAP